MASSEGSQEFLQGSRWVRSAFLSVHPWLSSMPLSLHIRAERLAGDDLVEILRQAVAGLAVAGVLRHPLGDAGDELGAVVALAAVAQRDHREHPAVHLVLAFVRFRPGAQLGLVPVLVPLALDAGVG